MSFALRAAPALRPVSMTRGLAIAFLLSFGPIVSNSFARFAYALLLPAMRNDLQWSYAQAGTINTVNALGYLVGALLVRHVIPRAGNRWPYAIGMVVTALALLATGWVRDFEVMLAMRALAGIGGAAVFICGGALSGNIFADRPQLATTTIAVYFAGAGLGLIGSGVVFPFALQASGDGAWPLMWQAMGVASLVMALASGRAAFAIAEPQSAAGSAHWRLAPFAAELASYLAFALGYIGYMTFVIAWMREHGARTGEVAGVWAVLGLATLLAPVLWRGPADRWPGGRPLAAVMAVLALGSALPLLAANLATMLLSAALFGSAMFSAPSSISSFIKRALPKPAWGSAMATFTVVFAAGQIVGPLATGAIADAAGSLWPGLALSSAVLALGVPLALLQRDLRQP